MAAGATSVEVLHSVPSAQAVFDQLAGYPLGEVYRCDLLSHGINDLYLVVADRGRFVLRIGPAMDPVAGRSPAELAYELDLLDHLTARGFACPEPVRRRDRHSWFTLPAPEGPRPAVLFSYVPGDLTSPREQVPELSARYGRMVAALHRLTDDFQSVHPPPALDLARLMDRPLALAAPVLEERPDDLRFLRDLSERVRRRINELAPEDAGPCHGDLTGGNAHQIGTSLALIDFEWCGTGWRAYDLAVFRWATLLGPWLAGWSPERSDEVWGAFSTAYRADRALADADLAAVAPLVVVRHFWLLGHRVANRSRWGLGETGPQALDWMLAFFREQAGRLDTDGRLIQA